MGLNLLLVLVPVVLMLQQTIQHSLHLEERKMI
ncbi:MAG: hypothetical protein ACI8RD_010116 [Bacillariaceae sp.]|jgi:hypothetical protein